MQFNPLSRTGLKLPEICLGTMTFGEQNSQQEAFRTTQLRLGTWFIFLGYGRDVFRSTKT